MRKFRRIGWMAASVAAVIAAGCISEVSDSLGDAGQGKIGANGKPLVDPMDQSGIPEPRGNGNTNGGGCGTCLDFDGSGDVGLQDLTYMLSSFGLPPQTPCVDVDNDGDVDLQDLAYLFSQFGTTCGAGGNANDNSVPNGNDNSVPNGNDNSVPNGNDNSVPNGNDNSVPNGNDNSVPNGNDNSVPNGNDNSVPNGNDNSVPNGNDNSVPNGNDNSVPNGNDNSVPNGNDNSVPNGNDNSVPNGNDNSVPNGNDNSVPNGNDNSVPNGNENGNDNGSCPDGSSQFRAQLSGDTSNEAEYRSLVAGCQRFRVRVRSLAAFTTYTVAINGVPVGQLTTDDRGRGELEYSPLPSGFPSVHAGDVITVGPAAGTFADDCSANANCNG